MVDEVADIGPAERRQRQRFMARRWGDVCFWVDLNGEHLPVNDVSLEGFSVPSMARPPEPKTFPFVLQLAGIPDRISGMAQMMNFISTDGGGQLGCRFSSFDGEGSERLHDWLTTHVIAMATVRISEKEAAAIVSGPSLI